MASSGPLGPSTTADDASIGATAWRNTGNITAEDGVVSDTAASIVTTHYLKATNYGFAIPAGATINGIVVEIKKAWLGTSGLKDNAVRIIKGGSIGATDKGIAFPYWTNTLTYYTYGSSSDLWGETWAASDINAATFGAAISAAKKPGKGGPTPTVDYIRITVYYTAAASTTNTLFFGGDF